MNTLIYQTAAVEGKPLTCSTYRHKVTGDRKDFMDADPKKAQFDTPTHSVTVLVVDKQNHIAQPVKIEGPQSLIEKIACCKEEGVADMSNNLHRSIVHKATLMRQDKKLHLQLM